MRLTWTLTAAALRTPMRAAHGEERSRPLVLVRVETDDRLTGHGEAAALHAYDGVSVDAVLSALALYAPALAAVPDGAPIPAVLDACRRAAALPQALAAVDLALWDLAGRRAGEPVWRLLGAEDGAAVAVNATVGADDPGRAAASAAGAVAQDGFGCVKVKVGVGDDAARVAAIRAAVGEDAAIRLDANGAWTVDEAARALGALAPLGIECCEEPVHGAAALADVAGRVSVPVSADESAPAVLDHGPGVCAAVCLKVSACGGISGVVRDAARARAAGYEVYLASTLDGPLGISAALHAAAVVRPDRPSGLATLGLFDAPSPLPVRGGSMFPPAGAAGLGLDPTALTGWYR